MGKEFFAGFYFVAATVIAVYFFRTMLRKDSLGKSMAKVLFAGVIAEFGYVIYLMSDEYFFMSLSNSIVFCSIDWILFFLLRFCISFTEQEGWVAHYSKYAVVPLMVDSAVLMTNVFHEHAIKYQVISVGGHSYLRYNGQIPFYVHLAMCYIMVVSIVVVLVMKSLHVARLYRVRYMAFVHAFVLVIGVNVVFLIVGGNVDLSIISYALLCCFLYFYVFDYKGTQAENATKAYFIENMNNPMVFFDYEDKMLMCNKRARELFELSKDTTREEFLAKNPYITLGDKEEEYFEATLAYKDQTFYFQVQYKFLRDATNRSIGTVFVYEDITEKKRALIQTEYNASHDMLTGTYNRNFLSTFKQKAKEEGFCPMYGAIFGVCGMNVLNEKYGIEFGDKVIRRMAWLLQQFSRVSDFVIRIDGSEMLLILPNTNEKKARDIFQKILRRVESFNLNGIDIRVEHSYFYVDQIEKFDKNYEEAHQEIIDSKNHAHLDKNFAIRRTEGL